VLLRWNPLISSVTYESHTNDIKHFNADEEPVFNWSIWEHDRVKWGDRFLMLCCGGDYHGIVMSGEIISDPFKDKSWRGDGKVIYYCNMEPDFLIDPLKAPILTSETLYREIPDYDWDHGHAGVLLDDDIAGKLEMLWFRFLYEHRDIFDDKQAACYNDVIEHFSNGIELSMQRLLSKTHGDSCELCGYNYQRIFGEEATELSDYYLLEPYNTHGDCHADPMQGLHCLCGNCRNYMLGNSDEPINETFYRLKAMHDKK